MDWNAVVKVATDTRSAELVSKRPVSQEQNDFTKELTAVIKTASAVLHKNVCVEFWKRSEDEKAALMTLATFIKRWAVAAFGGTLWYTVDGEQRPLPDEAGVEPRRSKLIVDSIAELEVLGFSVDYAALYRKH